MRILVLSNLFPTTMSPGGGIFISRRIEELRRRGHTVVPVAVGNRPDGRAVNLVRHIMGRIPSGDVLGGFIDCRHRTGLASTYQSIRQDLNPRVVEAVASKVLEHVGCDFDVIRAHGMYLPPAGAIAHAVATKIGIPWLVSVHGSDVNQVMGPRADSYAGVLRQAHGVITVSHALRDAVVSYGVQPSRTHVISTGYDPTVFYPPRGATRDSLRAVFVGSLREVKGADRLAHLVPHVLTQVPQVEFDIVGDGPLRKKLEMALRGYPAQFHGHVPQAHVADILRNASVSVVPSRNEGYPNLVVESHACSTPVVGTDVGGLPEAIGDSRFVVPHDDDVVGRLAERVSAVLLGQLARTDMEQRSKALTWDRIIDSELVVYEKLRAY